MGTSPLEFAFNSTAGYVTSEALLFPVIIPTPLLGELFQGTQEKLYKKKKKKG